MKKHLYPYNFPFELQSGYVLPGLELTYHTCGELNEKKDNVVWVCHALTANSDCVDWWGSLIGEGKAIDPNHYFIICVNIPGSCYGSSGPLSICPDTAKPWFSHFPFITIRDIVKAMLLLRKMMNLEKIKWMIGGSMGGYQALEWAVQRPGDIENLVLVASSAAESAWGIAIHTAQRMAIETDPTWKSEDIHAGAQGLKVARAIGMLSYRNYETFVRTQTDEEHKLDQFKASSYLHYQGEKLSKRFHAYSYWLLTKAMDSHHLGRSRGKLEEVLQTIRAKTICIGISSDILCPVAEQKFLARYIPSAAFYEIESAYGHDGFLIEGEKIGEILIQHGMGA